MVRLKRYLYLVLPYDWQVLRSETDIDGNEEVGS